MGRIALVPLIAFVLAAFVLAGHPDAALRAPDAGPDAGSWVAWNGLGILNAAIVCLFLVASLRRTRRR